MAYTPTVWADGSAGNTPITAARLNKMETGIADGQNAASPTVDTLSGAGATGKAVMKAADDAAARTAIGAGTSSLALGTTAATALAGNTALVKVGTGAGDALAGNTALLTLGTTATTALKGDTVIPAAPAAGTAAQLTAGTDTTVRTWAAKVLADEIDARVTAAIAAIPPAG